MSTTTLKYGDFNLKLNRRIFAKVKCLYYTNKLKYTLKTEKNVHRIYPTISQPTTNAKKVPKIKVSFLYTFKNTGDKKCFTKTNFF